MRKAYIVAAVISAAILAAPGSAESPGPTNLEGKAVRLFDANTFKPTVLIFVRTDCPISNRYAPELIRLHKEFSSRAIFYLVYADPASSVAMIRQHMAEYGYTFGALRDPGHDLVKLAKARVTPEAAVFSAHGQLLYHGRIDNRYVDFGKAMPVPTRRDLEEALRSTVAGRAVEVASTTAIGCFLADVQ
ncbi:MAG TPA: redoxin domain-containing protein [Bryobacteraceae bacterium]|nr:redoxin domain-containing protein [Bryobacteraceae bacterium]